MKRKRSDHITFDRLYDGCTYRHTGFEVFLKGSWWWEMVNDDGDIAYF